MTEPKPTEEMELEPSDIALVMNSEGNLRICLPKTFEDDDVSYEAMTMVAIATLLKRGEKDFMEAIDKEITRMCEEAEQMRLEAKKNGEE